MLKNFVTYLRKKNSISVCSFQQAVDVVFIVFRPACLYSILNLKHLDDKQRLIYRNETSLRLLLRNKLNM